MSVFGKIRSLNRDRGGASMVEWILGIAAIAIPLLVVLGLFGEDISNYLGDQAGKVGETAGKPQYTGKVGG